MRLIIVTFFVFSSIAYADSVAAPYDPGYEVSSVLKDPMCKPSQKVVIYSQTLGHYNASVYAANNLLISAASDSEIIGIFEGQLRDESDFYKSAEDIEVYAISMVSIGTAFFEGIGDVPVESNDEIFGAQLEAARRLSRKSISKGILLFPEAWKGIDRPAESQKLERLMANMDQCLDQISKGVSCDLELTDLRSANSAELKMLGRIWTASAQDLISQRERLKFLQTGLKEDILGKGRSVVFAKKVLENYCHAVELEKPIWLSIGSAHVEDVRRLLEQHLPSKMVSVVNTDKFIEGFEKISNFNSLPIEQELNQVLQLHGLTIVEILADSNSIRVFVSEDLDTKVEARRAVEDLMKKNSLALYKSRNWGNNIVIEPALPE